MTTPRPHLEFCRQLAAEAVRAESVTDLRQAVLHLVAYTEELEAERDQAMTDLCMERDSARADLAMEVATRLAMNLRCPCGNDARYSPAIGATPTLCGVCDVVHNGGRGTLRGAP